MSENSFPKEFLWGAATASYQVEGYPREDGAGQSVWDKFAHEPGHIVTDANADVWPAQYKMYKEDVQWMKWLGIKAYRFSIAWSRVFPEGVGSPNPHGLDYYNRLIDELLANGIEPWVTLFHWDMPQALEDRYGGWRSKETSKALADYEAYVVTRLSDRVKNFFTINEVQCFTQFGYEMAYFPPGLALSKKISAQTIHNGLLGHGLAVQAIRAAVGNKVRLGMAENVIPVVPYMETQEQIEAARKAFRLENANRVTAMMEGKYLDRWLEQMGKDAPDYTPQEMKIIGLPVDFVGVNIYTPSYYRADSSSPDGYRVIPMPAGFPAMDLDWLRIGPETNYWVPRLVSELWGVKDIYITENGCCCKDRIGNDGKIYDIDRIMFMRHYLKEACRAVDEGIPLKGLFAWSLIDNYEWCWGFTKRFGLFYVNYHENCKRIPKASADFYREVIRRGKVV